MGDRHAFRANWHDYNGGIYFVTICTRDKRHFFGYIKGRSMILTEAGKIAERCTLDIANHYTGVEVVNHVIMPNHIHMVISVGAQPVGTRYIASAQSKQTSVGSQPVGTRYIASARAKQAVGRKMGCLRQPRHGEPCEDFHHNSSLAVVVGTFKAAVTRAMRTRCIASQQQQQQQREQMQPVWQSRYHEHAIRTQQAYENIMNYIDANIERWQQDCFYTN